MITFSVKQTDVDAVCDYIKQNWEKCVRNASQDSLERIGLPYPYVVPCMDGMFNELFYWDTFFQNIGLECLDRWDLAKSNVDNLLHEISLFGYAPNSNLRLHLNRSQPPYLTSMVRRIYEHEKDIVWLSDAYKLLCKEYSFWMEQRALGNGLNRYFHNASGKELDAFYDEIRLRLPTVVHTEYSRHDIAIHDMAEAESGWDFNPRFDRRCADYWPIDLNTNLYVYEKNLLWMAHVLGKSEKDTWENRMHIRGERICNRMWDENIGIFMDYDVKSHTFGSFASLACFQPLWAGLATPEQAASTVSSLHLFEQPYGLSTCPNGRRDLTYQWDYPNGWAPLQYIAMEGMRQYGYVKEACRVAIKYIDLVTNVFMQTGRLWEKYNVVDGSIRVSDEYPMPELMDWTAGFYLYALKYLKEATK